eukprot:jgi/Botrbrau1/14990/Bobra.0018s0090.1
MDAEQVATGGLCRPSPSRPNSPMFEQNLFWNPSSYTLCCHPSLCSFSFGCTGGDARRLLFVLVMMIARSS